VKKAKSQELVRPGTNTLYEKRGNKYVPVAEYYTCDYFRKGNYLLQIMPGMTSIVSMVHPRTVPEVESALQYVSEGMLHAMRDKARTPVNPSPDNLTPKQKKALEAWRDAFGDNPVWFPSQQDIVDAGISMLRKRLEETTKY